MPTTNYYSVEGQLLGERGTGSRLDYIPDGLGSVVATSDASAAVVRRIEYKPYGTVQTSVGAGSLPAFQWVGTIGYRTTSRAESEYYVRARHYDAGAGVWTTVDPIWPSEPAHAYGQSSPTTMVDPSGQACAQSCCCTAGILLPGAAKELRNQASTLNTSDKALRYGHLFPILYATGSQDNATGPNDCTLQWFECSNAALTQSCKPGVWCDRTADIPRTYGFEQWQKRTYDCTTNSKTSGVVKDEPSMTTKRLNDLYNSSKRTVSRHLFILARLKSGSGCKGQVEAKFYQLISFDGTTYTLDFKYQWPQISGLCQQPPPS